MATAMYDEAGEKVVLVLNMKEAAATRYCVGATEMIQNTPESNVYEALGNVEAVTPLYDELCDQSDGNVSIVWPKVKDE